MDVLIFAGQGSPWQPHLSAALADERVRELMAQAERLLAPLGLPLPSLATARIAGPEAENPLFSVPGITAVQYHRVLRRRPAAAARGLGDAAAARGLGEADPSAGARSAYGYSQGVLGAALVQRDGDPRIFALAQLIGYAAALTWQRPGTPMGVLQVAADEARATLPAGVEVAIETSESSCVIAGEDVSAVPGVTPLPITVPFHTPHLRPALALVEGWLGELGWPDCAELAKLAAHVLVDPLDWPATLGEIPPDARRIDLGPGTTPGPTRAFPLELYEAASGDYAPRVQRAGDEWRLDTRFTRLTGKRAIMLAAMTPTTASPEIVAAAANAGFWAELAGGGQHTREILDKTLRRLTELLDPGVRVAFNTMYLDRPRWKLHMDAQVAAHPACDAIVVSAGFPEDAAELSRDLRAAGARFVVFKTGAIAHIRQVLALADELAADVILQVEDGRAGGHHSWESLPEMMLATYAEIRARDNVVLTVGGGVDPAAWLWGTWARDYGLPNLPVDGVFVGTVAMTAREAKTSPQVKELLRRTPGPGDWVGEYEVAGGMTSGRSAHHAPIHLIENAWSRCERLLAQGAPRDELIAAMNQTTRPYFGDIHTMTYAAVLQRLVELCYPWVDESWQQVVWRILQRCEGRLHPQDRGSVPTLFTTPPEGDCVQTFLSSYPQAADVIIDPQDVAWIQHATSQPGVKPFPFVWEPDETWLRDTHWQSEDPRYPADAVEILPGPVSVGRITTVDRPVAEILGELEAGALQDRPAEREIRKCVPQGKPAEREIRKCVPQARPAEHGLASVRVPEDLAAEHCLVTDPTRPGWVPDALFALVWPALKTQVDIRGLIHHEHRARCYVAPASLAGRDVAVRVNGGEVELLAEGRLVVAFSERFAAGPAHEPRYTATPREPLGTVTVHAPQDMRAFALVTGDDNPIHTDPAAAHAAGLDAPIVHGLWLSAVAQRHVPGVIRRWTYRMVGRVHLGDAITLTRQHVGVRDGEPVIEVTAHVAGELVAVGYAQATPRTTYVYPGQGVQQPGMGLDTCPDVWERADRFTRRELGFSVIEVVRDNPTSLSIGAETFRHPQGVLHLTQFTQVSLATLACAQTEDLRRRGLLREGARFAGHSLGEYTALAAYAQVMSLEELLRIVFQRGSTMQTLVPRNPDGTSNYQLAALRPNRIGVQDVAAFVAEVAAASGEFLEIVNYNLAGEQYSVAGTVAGIAALQEAADRRGERALVRIPGVDVPFHSTVLRPGVDEFRRTLDATLPRDIDAERLRGYVPNLVARPFATTPEFCDALLAAAPSPIVAELRDRVGPQDARTLLVELLAYQFASPVRWIESQRYLFDADEYIEVGLAAAPTLARLAERAPGHPRVQNVERDRLAQDAAGVQSVAVPVSAAPSGAANPVVANPVVAASEVTSQSAHAAASPAYGSEPAPALAAPTPAATSDATTPAAPQTATAAAPAAPAGPALEFTAADAIMAVLALGADTTPGQIADTDTLDSLTHGISARLNQLLIDMAAEVSLPHIPGAADHTVAEIRATVLSAAAGYQPFGPVLTDALNQRVRRLVGGKLSGVADQLSRDFGINDPGFTAHVSVGLLFNPELADVVRSLGGVPNTVFALSGANTAPAGLSASPVFAPSGASTSPAGLSASPVLAPSGASTVLLDDRWATAREDLLRGAPGLYLGTGEEVARQAEHAGFLELAQQARTPAPVGPTVVITGATPRSIGGALVARWLERGATVYATTSRLDRDRLQWAKDVFRAHATGASALRLVPVDLAEWGEIDDFAAAVGHADLLYPFAAPPVAGTLDEVGPATERQARVLLWGVERLIAKLRPREVILPGSPNRGLFGGDGAYGEVKAAFDALAQRAQVEPWGQDVTVHHARIGWVQGTGLMAANDSRVAAAQARGVRVYTPDEVATRLIAGEWDLAGNLDGLDFRALETDEGTSESEAPAPPSVPALPNLEVPHQPTLVDAPQSRVGLEDMVVIVSTGELSAWGEHRTRWEAERGELSAAGVRDLAWGMGLIEWREHPAPGWYAAGEPIAEEDIDATFRAVVTERAGIRAFSRHTTLREGEVYLDSAVTAEGAHGSVQLNAGTPVRVPREVPLKRRVGGELPDGFDPTRWGIPESLARAMDPIAAWNLVTTVDAFVAAGLTPAELLRAVHPAAVASTQGTGFGGLTSLQQMFRDRYLELPLPGDLLQETLPNVVAAHTMQSYVGGYGAMVHPVGACATAAVSVEEAVDKIRLGKADVVVAGAVDDITVESIDGFADLHATVDAIPGVEDRYLSRAGDRRRAGFVEAAGGGTVLLARGDVAARLGLPVAAVVAFAESFGDGVNTSIPAPGVGALAAARGGRNSRLAWGLRDLGLSADDIAVVSKHDTSTSANDPNEARLHDRIAAALGRTPGLSLPVISQKTVVGHAKGGAAALQIAGLCDVFRTGLVPGNRAVDCQDPVMRDTRWLVWPRETLRLPRPPRAALLTSLGFGHVSAVIALAHPGVFAQMAGEEWRLRADARLRAGARRRARALLGEPLYDAPPPRPADPAVEEALLLGEPLYETPPPRPADSAIEETLLLGEEQP